MPFHFTQIKNLTSKHTRLILIKVIAHALIHLRMNTQTSQAVYYSERFIVGDRRYARSACVISAYPKTQWKTRFRKAQNVRREQSHHQLRCSDLDY